MVTVLSLVNPVICAALLSKLTAGMSKGGKVKAATKAALIVAVILSGAAFVGVKLLQVFGISLDAFQVAGGLVLMWMGFTMLSGGAGSATSDSDEDGEGGKSPAKRSIAPLILFAASPGTITGVITLSVFHSGSGVPLVALVAVIGALVVTWLLMLLSVRTAGDGKPGPMHDLTTRFMGLVVLAMGVQFLLTGLKAFFA
tara:strand:- start:2115 stop:2711 length:597 start_codon:yes stop_codon:yes gene_type:complete